MVESRERENDRGFTLIEVMIVVAIIGVIAVLASVGYVRWIATSKMAEATNMIAGIKNGEENYHSQTGLYLNISKSLAPPDLYPLGTPTATKTPWETASKSSLIAAEFARIGVKADAPVYFGYAVVADGETCDPTCKAASIKLASGAMVGWEKEAGGDIRKPWFIASAMADTNGNGKYAMVIGMSFNSRLIVDNEGE